MGQCADGEFLQPPEGGGYPPTSGITVQGGQTDHPGVYCLFQLRERIQLKTKQSLMSKGVWRLREKDHLLRVKIMGCSPLLGDHLGSTSMTVNSDGTLLSEVRYSAFGEERYSSGTMTTDYLYTGQREEAEVGLYYYVARWYDPAIGRFVQADSIVPNPGSAVGFDRYSYAFIDPLKYSDPSGHFPLCVDGVECFTLPGYTGEEQWELGE